MYSRARAAVFLMIVAITLENGAFAQSLMRPTPPPLVTAENEPWYLSGEPITYAGNVYYPAGPQEFFNPNEMVRSGFFMGVPLYTRTTLEPFSIVYVPLPGRRMQPYQRGRTNEIAGTTGSRPTAATTPYEPGGGAPDVLQAAGPPSLTPFLAPFGQEPVAARGPEPEAEAVNARAHAQAAAPTRTPAAVATAGQTPGGSRSGQTRVRIGGKPQGINAIFVDFAGARWYSTGTTLDIDPARMERLGDYHGFPVWAEPDSKERRIYMPVTRDGTLAVVYSRTNPRNLLRDDREMK